jgi:hypothetical protein
MNIKKNKDAAHLFPPAIWKVHDATVNSDARTNNMCGRTCPSVYMACDRVVSKTTVRTIIQQDAVGNPPAKRTQLRHVQLQVRL